MAEQATFAQEDQSQSGMVIIRGNELVTLDRYLYEAACETYSAPTDTWDDLTEEAKNMWRAIARAAQRWAEMERASDD